MFGGVVLAVDEGPAEEDALAGDVAVLAAGFDEVGERPFFADGDEGGALGLGGAVEADGEAVGAAFFRELEDAGDDADGADADFAGPEGDAAVVGEDVEGVHDGVVVMHRLAHAHHDHVAEFSVGKIAREDAADVEDLGDDFAGAEVADEAHLPGGAEDAAHGAAGLGADADGVATVVTHEDGFDGLAVAEFEEEFAGEAVAAADVFDDGGLIEEPRFPFADVFFDPTLERRGEIEGGEVEVAFAVNGAEKGARVVGEDAGGFQGRDGFGVAEVVQGSGCRRVHADAMAAGRGRFKWILGRVTGQQNAAGAVATIQEDEVETGMAGGKSVEEGLGWVLGRGGLFWTELTEFAEFTWGERWVVGSSFCSC